MEYCSQYTTINIFLVKLMSDVLGPVRSNTISEIENTFNIF